MTPQIFFQLPKFFCIVCHLILLQVADEQIADEQIADEQIADKEHTEAVDHELRAIKTEHEQYEQDDDVSTIHKVAIWVVFLPF